MSNVMVIKGYYPAIEFEGNLPVDVQRNYFYFIYSFLISLNCG